MTISTILRCASLLAMIAAGLRAEIKIVSSTPMGFPCSQNVTPAFPCREADNGWLMLAKSSTKAVRAVLRYREGSETKTLTVLEGVNEANGLANIAFRPGRWLHPSDVIEIAVTELHDGATVITPGSTTIGPPVLNTKGKQ